SAALLPGLAPGGLDQDAPHGLGRGGEEMSLAVPLATRGGADQPQIGLVHQGRRLECVTGRLVRQPPGRHPAELVVNQAEQLLARLTVTVVTRRENTNRLVHRCATSWSPETSDQDTCPSPDRSVARSRSTVVRETRFLVYLAAC